jgi:hypothetical protein
MRHIRNKPEILLSQGQPGPAEPAVAWHVTGLVRTAAGERPGPAVPQAIAQRFATAAGDHATRKSASRTWQSQDDKFSENRRRNSRKYGQIAPAAPVL